jgi:hypothetical protein
MAPNLSACSCHASRRAKPQQPQRCDIAPKRIKIATWHTIRSIAHSTFKVAGDQFEAVAGPLNSNDQEDRPW